MFSSIYSLFGTIVRLVRYSQNQLSRVLLLVLLLSGLGPLFAQDEDPQTKLDFSGSFRTRGTHVGRDILLERQTPNYQVQDRSREIERQRTELEERLQSDIEGRKLGQPSQFSKRKEDLNFYDARFLYNMNFTTSKYVEGLWGMAVGDIPFGGRTGLPINSPDGFNTNVIGPGAGGEQGRPAGVNVQTNFLYINFKLPEENLSAKVGLQLFTSAQGRVMFATGTGVQITKNFQFLRLTAELGAIRARDRSRSDLDNNGFNDRNWQNSNIYFWKLKLNQFRNIQNEVYSYIQYDNDISDNEVGKLHWNGWFNEFNFSKSSLVVHGIINHGTVNTLTPIRDQFGDFTLVRDQRHYVKGGLYDFQYTYRFDPEFTMNFIAIGTTGRPGAEKDGTSSQLKGNGYRTLAPGFATSNIANDFTGGYALFNGRTFTGINQYGVAGNLVLFGPFLFTLGYYQIYSTRSPEIEANRNFNQDNFYRTTTYIGEEYNFNIRYNVFRDLQLTFRSGYFIAKDGLRALLDTTEGKIIREAFVVLEQRF